MVNSYESLNVELSKDVVLITTPRGTSGYRPPAGASLIPLTKAELITCSSHYMHTSESHESYKLRKQFFNNKTRALFAPDLDWFKGSDTSSGLQPCISLMNEGKSIACISQIQEEIYGGEYKSKKISKEDYKNLFHLAIRERRKLVLVVCTENNDFPDFLRVPNRPEFDAYYDIGNVNARDASKILADHYGREYGYYSTPSWIYDTPQPICNELIIKDIADAGRGTGSWPVSALSWLEARANNKNPNSPFNQYLKGRISASRMNLSSTRFWEWMVKSYFPRRNHHLFWGANHHKVNNLGLDWISNILD